MTPISLGLYQIPPRPTLAPAVVASAAKQSRGVLRPLDCAHGADWVKGVVHGNMRFLSFIVLLPRSEPVLKIWLLARTSSHSVVTRSGSTKLPLAAGGAREDGAIVRRGV